MNKEKIKQRIKAAIKAVESNAEIILFGSRARGTETSESDWDILVLLDKANVTYKDEQKIKHKVYEVELEVEESISTFVYSLLDWNTKMSITPLYRNILKEGIAL